MTRDRAITKVELRQVYVLDKPGWVEAHWHRADESEGSACVSFSLSHRGARWEISSLFVITPTTAALRDIPLARIETAANADPRIQEWLEQSTDEKWVKLVQRWVGGRQKLKRPKGRLTDFFYEHHVAESYRQAARVGLNPSKTLADDSGVPQGTVNRWIAEARKRGYLAPGSVGKVTT